MDPVTRGALISAGSTLAGGFMDKLFPGDSGPPGGDYKAMKSANMAAIAGKMEAAKKYGISALYAMGAPTASPSFSVGGDGGMSRGSTLASMGQDISRAVAAGQTADERALQALTLEKAKLENDYLRAQINSVNSRTIRESAPPMPAPGALLPEKVNPPERTQNIKAGVEYLTNPNWSDAQTFTNRYGENEILETLLSIIIGGADAYQNMPSRPSVPTQFLQGRTR